MLILRPGINPLSVLWCPFYRRQNRWPGSLRSVFAAGTLLTGEVGNRRWILQNNSGEPECVSQGARASVLRAKQERTLPDGMCGDSGSLQLPAALEGFLTNAVPWHERGHITDQTGKGRCQEQAPTTTANYLACRLLLALCKRRPWGKRAAKKVGDADYSGSMTFPWLAGTPRDL